MVPAIGKKSGWKQLFGFNYDKPYDFAVFSVSFLSLTTYGVRLCDPFSSFK